MTSVPNTIDMKQDNQDTSLTIIDDSQSITGVNMLPEPVQETHEVDGRGLGAYPEIINPDDEDVIAEIHQIISEHMEVPADRACVDYYLSNNGNELAANYPARSEDSGHSNRNQPGQSPEAGDNGSDNRNTDEIIQGMEVLSEISRILDDEIQRINITSGNDMAAFTNFLVPSTPTADERYSRDIRPITNTNESEEYKTSTTRVNTNISNKFNYGVRRRQMESIPIPNLTETMYNNDKKKGCYKTYIRDKMEILKKHGKYKMAQTSGCQLSRDEWISLIYYTDFDVACKKMKLSKRGLLQTNAKGWNELYHHLTVAIWKLHRIFHYKQDKPECDRIKHLFHGSTLQSFDKLSQEQVSLPTVFSFTTDVNVAKSFVKNNGSLWVIEDVYDGLYSGKLIGADVSWLSAFSGEKEYIVLPTEYSELLSNTICTINKKQLDLEVRKAMDYIQSDYIKEMKCVRNRAAIYYDTQRKNPLSVEHIMAIMIYCDWSDLCSQFSATFRRSSNDETMDCIKDRHRNFYWFGRYLKECVECFGIDHDQKRIRPYHGISRMMNFQSVFNTKGMRKGW
eukprot:CAMPEP_0201592974 /NCGR_PEP_ID=MMETSP0190_2-20130828/190707_1 /ASSEMBLY_ACC=CAM_ASM_000263 /TAXON_ID=37353 /ORGANISM="Rosalina sp." /LENGTH=565 /DNA_ID=CAMNT_0048051957 /DNA_START=765 /DNA_END=2459 /DNA_ORIENTATION=+